MTLLIRTRQLSDTLYRLFDGHKSPSAKREFLAAGAHDAVHEHHRAIGLLVAEGLPGSALALLRPMFDGCVRGLWLRLLASNEEVEQFADEKYDPKPDRVIKRLETISATGADGLRRIHDEGWKAMSNYVHGSFRQILGRLGSGFIGSNYTDHEVDALLGEANWFALLSAVELAEITGNEALLNAVIEAGAHYASKRA